MYESEYDPAAVEQAIQEEVARVGGSLRRGPASLLLIPPSTGWPMIVDFLGDEAMVHTVFDGRLGVGLDSGGDNEPLLMVIRAVLAGRAELRLSIDEDGLWIVTGWNVWAGENRLASGGDTAVATLRAPHWAPPSVDPSPL